MGSLQKAGGIAALILALAYVVGFAVMATLLNPGDAQAWSPAQKLAFVLERKDWFQMWTLLIYVLAGLFLVVLAVALHERLKAKSVALMPIATPIGLIWAGLVLAAGMVDIVGLESVATLHGRDAAQAVTVWLAVGAVHSGLGGGIELVGGVWVLLISLASLRSGALPRSLDYLGLVIALAGIFTVIPALGELAAVFGLLQIVWFGWTGMLLLREVPSRAIASPVAPGSAESH